MGTFMRSHEMDRSTVQFRRLALLWLLANPFQSTGAHAETEDKLQATLAAIDVVLESAKAQRVEPETVSASNHGRSPVPGRFAARAGRKKPGLHLQQQHAGWGAGL